MRALYEENWDIIATVCGSITTTFQDAPKEALAAVWVSALHVCMYAEN